MTTAKKIEFETTRFGVVELEEDKVLRFIDDIPGFVGTREFALLPHNEESPFFWLQSLELPELAFVVTHPGIFFKDYVVEVGDEDAAKLGIRQGDEDTVVILTIVTIPPDEPQKMTANLMAPVIINSGNNRVKQVILVDSSYSTKHFLLPST